MPSPQRAAQPGDIFLLLVPSGEELERLRREQHAMQAQFGGEIVRPIHITVERFAPQNGAPPLECVAKVQDSLSTIRSFPVKTDAIIQFFAPYWQSYVLRWRVERSPEWINFRDQIQTTLKVINCPSHFVRRRHATCTILKLESKVKLPSSSLEMSRSLFKVQDLHISTLKENGKFEVLEKLKFRD